MRKKKVTWLPGMGPENSLKKQVYRYEVPITFRDPEKTEIYIRNLKPGVLWTTARSTYVQRTPPSTVPHKYPYVGSIQSHSDMFIPMGTCAIYTGQTRVEEINTGSAMNMSVLRHTFLIGVQLVMCLDVAGFFRPVELPAEYFD